MSTAADDTTPTTKQRRKPSQVIDAGKAETIVGNVRELRPKGPAEWTDSAVAEAFARHIAGSYLFVPEWQQWMRWDNRRWAPDTSEAVHEAARRFIDSERIALIEQRAGHAVESAARQYAQRARIDSVVVLARRMHGIVAASSTFDQHPLLINVQNGTFDVDTGTLSPHDPTHRLTKCVDIDYVPGATHPDVDALVAAIPDEARMFVQRLIGHFATGDTSEDAILVLKGRGANGKSVFIKAVHGALGDYARPIDARLVMRRNHDDHPTVLASLCGYRVVYISETEEGGGLAAERLKAISGGDRLTARYMRGDYFDFTPTHHLIVATNHLPHVPADDDAVWRRLRCLVMPYTYRDAGDVQPGDRTRDPGLRDRLEHGEPQRQAMLAWILEGAVAWHCHGLGRSDTVDADTAAWRADRDVLGRFITERLAFDPALRLTGSELYATYTRWCEAEGHQPMSNTKLPAALLDHRLVANAGIRQTRPRGTVTYRGIGKQPAVEHHHAADLANDPNGEGCEGYSDYPRERTH